MSFHTHARELPSYLLEVDELGLVRVEVEARAVAAGWVSADGGRRVLELLRDVFDHRLTVHAQEGAADLKTAQMVTTPKKTAPVTS